jgi:uncharacterized protein (TIGR02246 family)
MTNATTHALVRPIAQAAHDRQALRERHVPTAQVRHAYDRWVAAVTGGDPERVVDLYADDAVLLATFAPEPRETREKLREYFDGFTALPNLRARTDRSMVQICDDLAFHDGLYTFSYVKDDTDVLVRARFSFAYRRHGHDWLIVRHHSSQAPAPVA